MKLVDLVGRAADVSTNYWKAKENLSSGFVIGPNYRRVASTNARY